MRKVLFAVIGIALIAGVVITAIAHSNRNSTFNLNVEALSIIEEGAHGTGTCWKDIHTVDNQLILVCNSCIYIQAKADVISRTGKCE